jgi:hypothetical protein
MKAMEIGCLCGAVKVQIKARRSSSSIATA